MQSLAAARPARASTLPARFKDFMSTDVAEAASSPFATWSDSALGKKRSRADRGLMSMRELTVAFAQGHASPAITAMPPMPSVDADGNVLASALFPAGIIMSLPSPDANLSKKLLRLSPPQSPTPREEE